MRKTSDLRKAEIVATILALADQIGPDRVTTGAVANEVGVTQAALFRHFPTKAAMWSAVADQVAETLTHAWNAAVALSELPVDRIRALIRAQLDQIAATPAMPMLLFSRELNVENAPLREAFRILAGDGLLSQLPNRGAQVVALSADDARAAITRAHDAFIGWRGVPAPASQVAPCRTRWG